MLDIRIKTILHSSQRYETVGDWQRTGGGKLIITVSDMNDTYKEALIAVHELVEAILCCQRRINQNEVDEFDIKYEQNRRAGDNSEPGDSPKAPYKKEHFFATNIERMICHELGIDWSEYEKVVNSL